MIIQLHDASPWKTSLRLIVGPSAARNKSQDTEPSVQFVYARGRRCRWTRFVLEFNGGDANHGTLCDGAAFSPHPVARRARTVSRSYRRGVFHSCLGRSAGGVASLD